MRCGEHGWPALSVFGRASAAALALSPPVIFISHRDHHGLFSTLLGPDLHHAVFDPADENAKWFASRCCQGRASFAIEQALMKGALDATAIEITIGQIGSPMGAAGRGYAYAIITIEYRKLFALECDRCGILWLKLDKRDQITPQIGAAQGSAFAP